MPYMKDEKLRANNYESTMQSKIKIMEEQIRAGRKPEELESKISRIKGTKTLAENIQKVLEFDRECEQNGHKTGSRYSALMTLHCLCQFAGQKPFKDFTKADVIGFLDAAKHRRFEDTRYRAKKQNVEKQLANGTMNLVKLRVKRFFQWLHDCERGRYPDCVRWMQLKTIGGDKELTTEDLPTTDEVKKMIECAENPRDRALISLLAESGARVGEVSMLQLKDLSWNEKGFTLTIHGSKSKSKFGRQIPLCACIEDVKRWVNDYHPFKKESDAPLFTSFKDRSSPKTNLKVAGIAGIVKRVAVRAGVESRIHMHPHKFRHLRASQLAEAGWNEPMLRQFFGWSKSSKMPATYIHMSQRSMNNRYYQMYGMAEADEKKDFTLEQPAVCSECGVQNPHGYRFCFRCNTPLDAGEQKHLTEKKEIENTLNLIAQDSELSDKFSTLLKEAMIRNRDGVQ